MPEVLQGIRIADFTHVLSGPIASHLLRLLGAEVVKVEFVGFGDTMRNYGTDRTPAGLAPPFVSVNAGKRSVALDLKSAAGREAALRLVGSADVVMENFRPGVMDRLGLGGPRPAARTARRRVLLDLRLRPIRAAKGEPGDRPDHSERVGADEPVRRLR